MKAWSLAWNSAEVPLPGSEARVIQVRRTGKGCLSYLIGSQGSAAVIDAALEPEIYLDLARRYGWTITAVLETHIHADHLSRARWWAKQSRAKLYLPEQEHAVLSFRPLREGDVLNIGKARLVTLSTPGQTLESNSYLLDGQALFTGDTLFLAGVGRPDLEANLDEARMRAHMLYHSLHRLITLPPETLILPAHTSEPIAFDGQPVAASLAEVQQRVDLLQKSEIIFVETILARIPPTPPNHQRIVALNKSGGMFDGDPTDLEAGANRCAVA
jgi:glyoxylase-like metal-dependent hydrolase (beta-lactamase superfamily II)